jgi:hypothetical protein
VTESIVNATRPGIVAPGGLDVEPPDRQPRKLVELACDAIEARSPSRLRRRAHRDGGSSKSCRVAVHTGDADA